MLPESSRVRAEELKGDVWLRINGGCAFTGDHREGGQAQPAHQLVNEQINPVAAAQQRQNIPVERLFARG
jgi:hypothetical protein